MIRYTWKHKEKEKNLRKKGKKLILLKNYLTDTQTKYLENLKKSQHKYLAKMLKYDCEISDLITEGGKSQQ